MIRQKTDPFAIDPSYDWEESDKIVAATLSTETEQRFLQLARELRESIMNRPLAFTGEAAIVADREQAHLRGKYELLLDLVADSKEAKVTQHLV